MTTNRAQTAPAVRRSALDRDTAMRLAATEYRRYRDQLRGLLYSHFESKNAIYDAMFGQAWQAYDDTVVALELPEEPREVLRALGGNFVEFAMADLPRYLLMDQRVIPDFQPSAENYAPAVRLFERVHEIFTRITGEVSDDLDLFIVMISGLVGSQWSNDPGGTRYIRQLDRVVDLLADELGLPRTPPSREDRRS